MTHDQLRGRISSDRETGPFLVVDELRLTMEDLAEILSTHEGWGFELTTRIPRVTNRVRSRPPNNRLERVGEAPAAQPAR